MLRFAICDDSLNELERTRELLQDYLDLHPELAGRISVFSSADAMLEKIEEAGSFDLYILDIIMPRMSGIELGKRLRKNGDQGQIIYLSTSRDYAVESYDAGAFFYLTKPASREKLMEVLENALENMKQKRTRGITVHTRSGLHRVSLDEILFVEQMDRSMHYHLADGSTVCSCVIRKSFVAEAQPLLEDSRFVGCGSSYVLNLHRIKNISKNIAVFTTGETLALPITLQHDVKKKWMNYWLEREELG